MRKLLAALLLSLAAATAGAQQKFKLFDQVAALPGAAVGDIYCTSTTGGQIVRFPLSSSDGYVLSVDLSGSVSPCKLKWIVGGGSSSPLTTKGDLWGFSTVNARVPVGANGYVLTADSSAALGVSYQPALIREHVSGTQDGVNATFTIDGTLTWTMVWLLRNGSFVALSDFSAGGTGNRTLTLTMSGLPDGTGPEGNELLEVVGVAR